MQINDLDKVLNDVQLSATSAQRAKAELFRNDQPVFADPEQQNELVQRALQPLQSAVEGAHALADQAFAEAKRLDTIRAADVWAGMSDADLQRAQSLKPFVAEFVTEANGPELANRLAWVAANGSNIEKRLYLEQASRRKDVPSEIIRPLLAQLTDPKQAQAIQAATAQAEALRVKAAGLRFRTSDLLAEVDGSKAAALEQKRQEYQGYF